MEWISIFVGPLKTGVHLEINISYVIVVLILPCTMYANH